MIRIASMSIPAGAFHWNFINKPDFDLQAWIKEREYLYDADNCGDEVTFYVVVTDGNPRFYKSEHDWWWHNYGCEDSELVNDFAIYEVSREDLDDYSAKNLRFVV